MNLQDLFGQLFNHPRTLEDLGIKEERSKQIMSATIDAWKESLQNLFALACVLSAQINAADARRKEQEQQAHSAEVEKKHTRRAPILCSHFPHGKEHVITCLTFLFLASGPLPDLIHAPRISLLSPPLNKNSAAQVC